MEPEGKMGCNNIILCRSVTVAIWSPPFTFSRSCHLCSPDFLSYLENTHTPADTQCQVTLTGLCSSESGFSWPVCMPLSYTGTVCVWDRLTQCVVSSNLNCCSSETVCACMCVWVCQNLCPSRRRQRGAAESPWRLAGQPWQDFVNTLDGMSLKNRNLLYVTAWFFF